MLDHQEEQMRNIPIKMIQNQLLINGMKFVNVVDCVIEINDYSLEINYLKEDHLLRLLLNYVYT
jgi:hypothetical protein